MSRKEFALYLVPAAAAAVLAYLFSFRTVITHDYGVLIDRCYRIFLGEIPYKDTWYPTTPLTYFIQAAIFKIFAPKIFWMKMYVAAANAWMVLCAVFFARRVLKIDFALTALFVAPVAVAWSPGIILMRPWYDYDANLFAFTALLLLALAASEEKRGLFFAAGISAALSVFSKQNIGAGATISGFLFILLQPAFGREKFKRCILFGLGLAAASAAMTGYFVAHDAWREALDWVFVKSAKRTDNFLHQAFGVILRPDNNFVKFAFLLYAAGVAAAWRERRRNVVTGNLKLGIVLFGWLTMWFGCLAERGNDYPQQQIYLSALCAILLTAAFEQTGGFSFSGLKKPRAAAAVLAALIAMAWPVRVNWKIPFKFQVMKWTPENERLRGMNFERSDYRFVQDLLEFEKKIPKEEGVFIWPDPTFFYFATGRRSPVPQTAFVVTEWESPASEIAKMGERLDAKNIQWVIVGQETYFDFGPLRYGVKENWEEAVQKGMALGARGDHSAFRDYLHRNFTEVPGPVGYWTLKRKAGMGPGL